LSDHFDGFREILSFQIRKLQGREKPFKHPVKLRFPHRCCGAFFVVAAVIDKAFVSLADEGIAAGIAAKHSAEQEIMRRTPLRVSAH
jgi:hypothetical protein